MQGTLEGPKHRLLSERLNAPVRYGAIYLLCAYIGV